MIPFVQQPGDPIAAAVLTAIEQTGDQSTSALQTALAQAVGLTTTAAEKMDPVLEQVKQISIQVWDVGVGLNGTNGTSLKEILEPALELLKPVVAYVAKNPWVLIPILIPALDAWLLLVGFGVDGIVAGSIAAGLQGRIGNVPKGSLFAFLQSNGARGFARAALRMGLMWLVIAVLLAAVGKLLIDQGLVEGEVSTALERVWNHTNGIPDSSDTVSGAVHGRNILGAIWAWGFFMIIWAFL